MLRLSIIAHGIGLQVSLQNLREVLTKFFQMRLSGLMVNTELWE